MSSRLLIRNLGRASGLFCGLMLISGPSAARPIHTNGPQPFTFTVRQLQITWVEQESAPAASLSQCLTQMPCVINDSGCLWNVGDFSSDGGAGYLAADTSTSASRCYIADGYEHATGDNKQFRALVSSSSSDLDVSLANDQGVALVAATPTFNVSTRLWDYSICTYDLTGYPNPVDWYPSIPNPDGNGAATGLQVVYTITITNPTGHQVKAVYGAMKSYSDFDAQQTPC